MGAYASLVYIYHNAHKHEVEVGDYERDCRASSSAATGAEMTQASKVQIVFTAAGADCESTEALACAAGDDSKTDELTVAAEGLNGKTVLEDEEPSSITASE